MFFARIQCATDPVSPCLLCGVKPTYNKKEGLLTKTQRTELLYLPAVAYILFELL